MNNYLDNAIIKLCNQPRSFEFISKNLNGLDPVEAMKIISRLESEGILVSTEDMWCVKEVSINDTLSLYPSESELYLQRYMGYFDFLKTPHPLDFEWRNSSFSLNNLLQKLSDMTQPKDKLLFLGMPTLFATAIQKDFPRTVRLIERNSPIIRGLKKINTDEKRFQTIEDDIFTISPSHVSGYHCVVMDPPWYTPHFFQFMWLAASAVSFGGLVAISLPPINTRPNIMDERLEWFSFCKKLGLCLESLEPQILQYAMPFFEFNAFRAAGITSILPFWRKGDLAIFRKINNVAIDRPENVQITKDWIEREYKSCRIRVKSAGNFSTNTEKIQINSLVKGDILPTVSARDERRNDANFWTSGNRIFKTNKPEEVITAIDAIINSEVLNSEQQQIKDFLDMISDIEKNEYKEYLEYIYYEMERQID